MSHKLVDLHSFFRWWLQAVGYDGNNKTMKVAKRWEEFGHPGSAQKKAIA